MSTPTAFGSLDDLVDATVADFARSGIDCSAKLSLLESLWNSPGRSETVDEFLLALDRSATREGVRAQLDQLVALGLLVREDAPAGGAVRYHLTDSPLQRGTLARLFAACSQPALRTRVSAKLRCRPA